jgi:hypothetical protein
MAIDPHLHRIFATQLELLVATVSGEFTKRLLAQDYA